MDPGIEIEEKKKAKKRENKQTGKNHKNCKGGKSNC